VPSPTADPVPGTCALQQLPVPAGQPPKSVVTGGDPTGRYILGRAYPGGASHPVLIWDNGKVHAITMTGQDQELTDVNAAGVAVGVSVAATSDQPTAWVYQDGRLTRLAGDATTANGINERGVIAGSVGGKPAFWSSAGSAPTMLTMPGSGWTGQVNAIDEDGTMVGEVHSGPTHGAIGYLWHPDGTGESLPVPVVDGKPVDQFTARSIRNGWVVGWAALDVGPTRYIYAPRWNLRTGAVDAPGGLTAEAVNDRGWIAGSLGQRAVLVDGGAPVSLPDLGGTRPPVTNTAYTISDDGTTLAGQVESADGDPVAVQWHCR
jgi:uncharacterized membrane protein